MIHTADRSKQLDAFYILSRMLNCVRLKIIDAGLDFLSRIGDLLLACRNTSEVVLLTSIGCLGATVSFY